MVRGCTLTFYASRMNVQTGFACLCLRFLYLCACKNVFCEDITVRYYTREVKTYKSRKNTKPCVHFHTSPMHGRYVYCCVECRSGWRSSLMLGIVMERPLLTSLAIYTILPLPKRLNKRSGMPHWYQQKYVHVLIGWNHSWECMLQLLPWWQHIYL